MRKGELGEHPVPEVLTTVAAERLSGQIDLDGDPAVTIYIVDGRVALVCESSAPVDVAVDDDMDDAAYLAAVDAEEARLRADSVELLRTVVDRADGWYYHHPLGEHDASALWGWDVDELLAEASRPSGAPPAEGGPTGGDADATATAVGGSSDGAPPSLAAVRTPDGPAPAPRTANGLPLPGEVPPREAPQAAPAAAAPGLPGSGRRLRLNPVPPADALDDAAWTVLLALTGAAHESEVAARLGWPEVQTDIVVSSMVARGILTVDDT